MDACRMYTFRSSALSEFVQAAREQYALVCRDEIVIHLPESLVRACINFIVVARLTLTTYSVVLVSPVTSSGQLQRKNNVALWKALFWKTTSLRTYLKMQGISFDLQTGIRRLESRIGGATCFTVPQARENVSLTRICRLFLY
jgi:hypothetical protein